MAMTATSTTTHPEFYCSITLEIMIDPVIASDGFSYERKAIESWFEYGHKTSPRTGAPLSDTELIPNNTLKNLIMEWMTKNPTCANDDNSISDDSIEDCNQRMIAERAEIMKENSALARRIAELQEQTAVLDAEIESKHEEKQEMTSKVQIQFQRHEEHDFLLQLSSLLESNPQEALNQLECWAIENDATTPQVIAFRGLILFKLGRIKDALRELDDCLQRKTDEGFNYRHPDVLNNKGIVLHSLGKLEEALKCFEEAAVSKPTSDILSNQGAVLMKLGRFQDALNVLEKSLEKYKNNPAAWRNRGDALKMLGRKAEALICYSESLRIRPNDKSTKSSHMQLLKELGKSKHCIHQ